MSGSPSTGATPDGAAPSTPDRVPLDRLMLAMDVVDTLRHHRDLVARELDGEARRRAFVDQVQAIYDAQGIDVDESVIAEAVDALEKDRFAYTPPRRTVAVRLAEIYVERGRWALRAGIAVALVALLWTAFVVPARLEQRRLADGFVLRVAAALEHGEDTRRELERLAADGAADAARAGAAAVERARTLAASGFERLVPRPTAADHRADPIAAEARVSAAERDFEGAAAELATARNAVADATALGDARARLGALERSIADTDWTGAERAALDADLAAARLAVATGSGAGARRAVDAVEARLRALGAARGAVDALSRELAALRQRIDATDPTADAAARVAALAATAGSALAARDAAAATTAIERLRALGEAIEREYELRIVSRPGQQSGVWRYSEGRRDARNFYVIVEAVDDAGRPVELPVTSEEDQRTEVVRRFGLRVPEAVFERVRADKQDNGIIDDAVVGTKRRGALEPTFRIDVLPGRITQW